MIFRKYAELIFYTLVQQILAPGKNSLLVPRLRELPAYGHPAHEILDVGCGPYSAFFTSDPYPIGCDFSGINMVSYVGHGAWGVVGNAEYLPFQSENFASVFSVGLFHHLDEGQVKRAVGEMFRVCRPGGRIVVVDGVLPIKPWHRPFAYIVRKLDRGRHMRYQPALVKLLCNQNPAWDVERLTTTYTGLEAVICRLKKPMQKEWQ
jgi:SAM-dependent methyltransferase